MVRKLNIDAEVPPDREIRIALPADVPLGPVQLEIVVRSNGNKARTLGDLAHSEFFGMWKDREDIADSVEFARRLRDEAWKRRK